MILWNFVQIILIYGFRLLIINFQKKKLFNTVKDKSETGSFTELFRTFYSKWRTETPIFSIIGDGKKPSINIKNNSIVNPFEIISFFHLLYKMKSNIFFYGTEINSASFIMYVEEQWTSKYCTI